MFRLVLLERANSDLDEIFEYVTHASGKTEIGLKVFTALIERCRRIADGKFQLGRPRPELGQDVRSLSDGRYVLFFRYRGDTLEMIRIIEGHRDLPTVFDVRDMARPVFEAAI